MSKRKQPKPKDREIVAIIYRDKNGNLQIEDGKGKDAGDDLPELEWEEVRPPNRKRRKSA